MSEKSLEGAAVNEQAVSVTDSQSEGPKSPPESVGSAETTVEKSEKPSRTRARSARGGTSKRKTPRAKRSRSKTKSEERAPKAKAAETVLSADGPATAAQASSDVESAEPFGFGLIESERSSIAAGDRESSQGAHSSTAEGSKSGRSSEKDDAAPRARSQRGASGNDDAESPAATADDDETSETSGGGAPRRKGALRRRRSGVSTRVSRSRSARRRPVEAADSAIDEESASQASIEDKPLGEPSKVQQSDSETPSAADSLTCEPALSSEPSLDSGDGKSEGSEEFIEEPPGHEESRRRNRSRSRGRPRGGRSRRSDSGDRRESAESAPSRERSDSRRRKAGTPSESRREDEDAKSTPKEARTPRGRTVRESARGVRSAFTKRILMNAVDPEEVRIAVIQDDRLHELHYDRPREKRYLGNIYKGRVVNIEPAIQAAFVEIGIGRNGFLHVSDVLPAYIGADGIPLDSMSKRVPDRRRLKIQDILREGQELLVQISKDAIGAKGPSLTTYVSIPGKYLVLMPGVPRYGVSKKIQDDEDRSQLRKLLANLNPPEGMGYIVRTACEEGSSNEFEKDFDYLMKIWEEIGAKVRGQGSSQLVYAESDLVIRTMRDLFGPNVGEILVDEESVYERARAFCMDIMPEAASRLKNYTGVTPIFSRFGVEDEIEKIYNRKVALPSGGHIVVEQTEALVAIDVNSGRYRDEEDLEATALKTNLEAAEEIARQLRLRDLGGVIINDFIDMERESNRRQVEQAFRSALKGERAKCWMQRISRFGIVELTRQRARPSFERAHYESCRHCRGTGVVMSTRSAGTAILRQMRAGLAMKRKKTCEVVAQPGVVEYLLNERRSYLVELEERYRKRVTIKSDQSFNPDQFVIRYY